MKRVFMFLFSVCLIASLAVMTTGCDMSKKATETKPAEPAPANPGN